MTGTTQALHDLPAHALLRAYRDRSLSPVEVMHDLLAHVQRWEPALHATYLLRPEAALARARERGPLAARRAGRPARRRSRHGQGQHRHARRSHARGHGRHAAGRGPAGCPTAARLREAGAILFAKTTMPDYGMLSSGLSRCTATPSIPGIRTRRRAAPAPARCGGRLRPLHVGTDIGGSIRLPAGWCGIFGLKPSLGRVPIDPPYTGRCAGPMTRSVADAALMMQVLSLPDARDSMGLPHQEIAWHSFDMDPAQVRGLRIGLLLDAGCGLPLQPRVRAVVEQAAAWLESAGAHIERIEPWLTRDMLDGLDHFWRMRSHVEMQSLTDAQRRVILPFIREWADSAAPLTSTQLFVASQQSHLLRTATVRATAAYDYVLSPWRRSRPSRPTCPAPPTTRCGRWSTLPLPCPTTCPNSPPHPCPAGMTGSCP